MAGGATGVGGRVGQGNLSLTKGGSASPPKRPSAPTGSSTLSERERIWVRAMPRPGGGCCFKVGGTSSPALGPGLVKDGAGLQGLGEEGREAKGVDSRLKGQEEKLTSIHRAPL